MKTNVLVIIFWYENFVIVRNMLARHLLSLKIISVFFRIFQMKFFQKNKNSLILVAGLIVTSVGAFAAGKKSNSDEWYWSWLGTVEDAGHMFPDTKVAKFRDKSSGVVCYVYSSQRASSVTFTTNGVAKDGVKGSDIGTMSCVAERR